MTASSPPLTLDGYIRVSQVRGRAGDSFISPAVQRERIEAWMSAYGHNLNVVHEELDASGANVDRPLLLEAVARVERGESDGIVVAKLDRFARSLVDGLRMIERIQDQGGTFVSVADGLDLTTDTGRLVLRIMLSLAEFELDRVRGNWSDAKARAIMRGIHPCAMPPFGYRREGSGGPLLPDGNTAPLVRELFERRSQGAGPSELADWLAGKGVLTQRRRASWSHRAVKDILRNDVYIGVASAGAVRNEHAHEPLVDRGLFESVQWRGVQIRPRSDEPSPIRPLLRCAGCRYAMRAERRTFANGATAWYFTCRTSSHRTAWRCDEPAAVRDDGQLEAWIVDRFFDALPELSATARVISPRLGDLEREVERERTVFEQWRDDARLQERLGMDAYVGGLTARKDALNAALGDLGRERARAGIVALPAGLEDLRGQWSTLTASEQRDLLTSAIRCVFVRGSRRTAPLDGRLHLIWNGEPVDLPSRGDRGWDARPYVFAD